MPVFGTSAATFNDDGVTALYQHLAGVLAEHGLRRGARRAAGGRRSYSTDAAQIVPPAASAISPRSPRRCAGTTPRPARRPRRPRRVQRLSTVRDELAGGRRARRRRGAGPSPSRAHRRRVRRSSTSGRRPSESYSRRRAGRRVRDRELRTRLTRESLSGNPIPRVALPRFTDHGDLLRFLRAGEPARPLPLHRGGVPVQAGERGPGPHVRGRGRPVSHQPAVPLPRRAAARPRGCPPRSTRSRSTVATPTSAPTSTARSAPPGCRSPRSTT